MAYGTVIRGNKADVICRIAFNNAFFFNDRFFNIRCFPHFKVKQLMSQPEATLSVNDTMEIVMKKFDQTDSAMLPVLDNENQIGRAHV